MKPKHPIKTIIPNDNRVCFMIVHSVCFDIEWRNDWPDILSFSSLSLQILSISSFVKVRKNVRVVTSSRSVRFSISLSVSSVISRIRLSRSYRSDRSIMSILLLATNFAICSRYAFPIALFSSGVICFII